MGITLGKKQLNKGRVSLYLNYSYLLVELN